MAINDRLQSKWSTVHRRTANTNTPPTPLSQESDGEVSVMVSRTMGASGVVDLEYVTHDLSAESGVHYTATGEGGGTLQFNPHEVKVIPPASLMPAT